MVLVAVTAMSSKLAATANKATATINTPLFRILIIIIAFTVAERKCWMVRYKEDPSDSVRSTCVRAQKKRVTAFLIVK